jgi:competence protein ComEC
MGNRVVVPYLRSAGVNSLDAVICSHFDKDHVGGLPDVLNLVPVGRIYSACQTDDDAGASRLKAQAERLDIEWHNWFAGTTVKWDEVTCVALHPPGSVTNWIADAARWGDNTWSLVIQGSWQKRTFLLTGDADEAGEAIQLNSRKELRSDLLKIGHHGSATSSSEPYISAVRPAAASIGTGPNAFGLPSPQVIDRLDSKGVAVLRTDLHGAIEYRFEYGKIVIYTFNDMAHVTTCTK